MTKAKQKILIVEDSRFFSASIKLRLKAFKGIDCFFATNYAEARQIIRQNENRIFLALLDLNLPDAPNGEIIDLTHEHNIPSVIFSARYDRDFLEYYYNKGVIDCVYKDSPASLDYFISMVRRLLANSKITVMVVEDTVTTRKILTSHLMRQHINVIEARDGKEALKKIANHPEINLVLTDHEMPNMNGFELTKKLRTRFSVDQLPIIGMTSLTRDEYAAQFLKHGANDFINKPFSYEELLCRVSQNLDMYFMLEELKSSVYKDDLTGLYNRRYLFEYGENLLNSDQKRPDDFTLAIIDIDNFKSINDSYGYQTGDEILLKISESMESGLNERGMIARFGGAEFCVIIHDRGMDEALNILEDIRASIAGEKFQSEGYHIKITASIGICNKKEISFEQLLHEADQALFKAKDMGRNCLRVA